MKVQDFDFSFPTDLIATQALPRGQSRVLHLNRPSQGISEISLPASLDLFEPGDVLVLNNSRVLWARLEASKGTGARLEVFFLRAHSPQIWEVLVKGSVKPGNMIHLPGGRQASVKENLARTFLIEFSEPVDPVLYLTDHGAVPLPPYIVQQRRFLDFRPKASEDKSRYQTAWAKIPGSVAAPTAGLHFAESHLQKLREKGVLVEEVTLHVGAGTFLPIDTDDLESFQIHPEQVEVSQKVVAAVCGAKARGKRIWACGTTSLRALETAAQASAAGGPVMVPYRGETRLFVKPGYSFKAVDCLMTNFHQPRSTLLALAVAFAGNKEFLMQAYRFAIDKRFRLFSYGDLCIFT